MFNDKYGLTRAVLEGRKTQTRRVIKSLNDAYNIDSIEMGIDGHGKIYFTPYIEGKPTQDIYPSYQLEDVAIAQGYRDNAEWAFPYKEYGHTAGWSNKMFVKAELMPYRIKITNIRIEHLFDISDEDCLEEGIEQCETSMCHKHYCTRDCDDCAPSPREAFATLIDKVSGKGTWDSNPWVFVYDFELIK